MTLTMLISLQVFSQTNSQSLETKLQGNWKGDKACEMSTGSFIIGENNPITVEVNSNQIYILANVTKSTENKYIVYLKEPDDLGRGGMQRPWIDYSKDKPIAELIVSDNKMKVIWKGFYNTKSKAYEWIEETDWFSNEEHDGYFYKCE